VDFCLKPFVSPAALLGLDLTALEAVQILDVIAASPPKFVFLGVDLAPAEPQLAAACLTGGESRPVDGCNSPRDAVDGVDQVREASASPVPTGTTC